MRLYREFTDQAAIDAEYDPTRLVPEAPALTEGWRARSAEAAKRPGARLGLRYGPTIEEYLDIFPAGEAAPVHAFIHGGYWRRYTARDFAWVAEPLVARGITAVIVNYALCPSVSVTEITRQIRAAIAWCHRHIAGHGGDPARLTLSGHSAGGHLAAMALATDWQGGYGLPNGLIKGAIPLSGLYDLRPFPYSWLQPALQLTTRETLDLSPIDLAPAVPAPILVAVGGAESAEFRRQSRDFTRSWREKGADCRYLELEGANHFTALDRLFAPEGPLIDQLEAWSE